MISIKLLCFACVFAFINANPTTETPTTAQEKVSTEATNGTDAVKLTIKQKVEALTENCKTLTKLSPELLKITVNQAIPKTVAEKCFLECIYNGVGVTKDGVFSEEGARALAHKRFGESPEELVKANSLIDACLKEIVIKDASEKCASGRLVRECFVKHGSKINFFPRA